VTRFDVLKVVVQDTNVAGPSTRAVTVHNIDDVNGTADVAEVLLDTLTDAHSTVARMRDE